jgi:hypothetical protein
MADQGSAAEDDHLREFGEEIVAICSNAKLVRGMVEMAKNNENLSPMEKMGKVVELLNGSSSIREAWKARLNQAYAKYSRVGYIAFLEKQNKEGIEENRRLLRTVATLQAQVDSDSAKRMREEQERRDVRRQERRYEAVGLGDGAAQIRTRDGDSTSDDSQDNGQ